MLPQPAAPFGRGLSRSSPVAACRILPTRAGAAATVELLAAAGECSACVSSSSGSRKEVPGTAYEVETPGMPFPFTGIADRLRPIHARRDVHMKRSRIYLVLALGALTAALFGT